MEPARKHAHISWRAESSEAETSAPEPAKVSCFNLLSSICLYVSVTLPLQKEPATPHAAATKPSKKKNVASQMKIVRLILPYFWPKGRPFLRLIILICLLTLVGSKFVS